MKTYAFSMILNLSKGITNVNDYIAIEKVWQDDLCYQIKVTCASDNITVTNDIYISSNSIDDLSNGLNSFITGTTKEILWESGEKGDDSTAFVSFRFIHKDKIGHIWIEVFIELDDGGKYSTHNCCFYVNTEVGLLEQFYKKLPKIKDQQIGYKIILNDQDNH